MDLKTPEGKGLRDHLLSKGIKKLGAHSREVEPVRGTFEHHIKEVQEDFWGRRFKVYGQWRKDWFDLYRRRCWFKMKTGFVCSGLLRKNQVINYPVQGAAFHCLLWVLIELQKWLNKNNMRTMIVGQIHDSLLIDAPEDEKMDVLYKCHDLMTRALQEAWPWIIIPLEVEIDTSVTNWYEKAPFTLAV
jgi:DNA polymerase I-like protein with 3'-5' exonuclease and polymerase domains